MSKSMNMRPLENPKRQIVPEPSPSRLFQRDILEDCYPAAYYSDLLVCGSTVAKAPAVMRVAIYRALYVKLSRDYGVPMPVAMNDLSVVVYSFWNTKKNAKP